MVAKETDTLLTSQTSTVSEHEPEDDHTDHEEATSMFSRMKTVFENSTSTRGAEAIKEEYNHVKEAFKDQLAEANEGDGDFFLSMALTKNLSLLPSKPEIVQAEEEIVDAVLSLRRNFSALPTKNEDTIGPIVSSTVGVEDPEAAPPLSAYLILGSAVCALSSIGPFLAKQQGVDPCMKIVWRFQGTAILLSPLFAHSAIKDGWPKLTWAQWATFVCAASSYSVLCVAFAMALQFTTVANATILTNSQSILLVAAKLLFGYHVLFLEGFGVAVAFLGGVLCAKESAGLEGAPANGWLSVWGDCLGLISAAGGMGAFHSSYYQNVHSFIVCVLCFLTSLAHHHTTTIRLHCTWKEPPFQHASALFHGSQHGNCLIYHFVLHVAHEDPVHLGASPRHWCVAAVLLNHVVAVAVAH